MYQYLVIVQFETGIICLEGFICLTINSALYYSVAILLIFYPLHIFFSSEASGEFVTVYFIKNKQTEPTWVILFLSVYNKTYVAQRIIHFWTVWPALTKRLPTPAVDQHMKKVGHDVSKLSIITWNLLSWHGVNQMDRWLHMTKSLPAGNCRAMGVTTKKRQDNIHHVTQGKQRMWELDGLTDNVMDQPGINNGDVETSSDIFDWFWFWLKQ